LLLNLGRELSSHSGQLELGGEGQSGELGLLGVLESERLKSDETEWDEKNRIRFRPSPEMMAEVWDTYYSLELGPMEGSGVNLSSLMVETSIEGEIDWREICC